MEEHSKLTLDTPINVDNYRAHPAINYSKLSALDKHPSKINEEKDFSDGLRNGDILDILCFDPDKFEKKYYVSDQNSLPTEIIQAIIKETPSTSDEDLIATARNLEFGASNWKDDTILNKIKSNGGQEYIDTIISARGRHIVSLTDYTMLYEARNTLFNHSFTKDLFEKSDYQVPYLGQVKDLDNNLVKAKCLLDIRQDKGDYILITDLKYSSSPLNMFPGEYIRWKYYLQASLYSDIVEDVEKKPVFFQFVIFSSVDKLPLVYTVTELSKESGRFGAYKKSNGYFIKGYKQLIKEYNWHINTGKFDYPYEVYENNGKIELDVFNLDIE